MTAHTAKRNRAAAIVASAVEYVGFKFLSRNENFVDIEDIDGTVYTVVVCIKRHQPTTRKDHSYETPREESRN